MVNAARILPPIIQQYVAATPHRSTELIALMHEANYIGSDNDDHARQLISELSSQGSLAHVAFTIKVKMLNALLSSSTGDEDENAINSVMQAAKDYDQAEVYQPARSAAWDSLYSNVDGEEYDTLLNILHQPV